MAFHEEREVLRARDRTLLERPADVRAYFRAQFRGVVPARAVVPPSAPVVSGLRSLPSDDPYAF